MPQPSKISFPVPFKITYPVGQTFPAQTYKDSSVAVNVGVSMGVLPSTGRGLNTPAYNGFIQTPASVSEISALKPGLLRYPDGAGADFYDWRTNAIVPGVTPSTIFESNPSFVTNTFDAWVNNILIPSGAQGLVVVNYGSFWNGSAVVGGSPSVAADWVRYANKGQVGFSGTVPTYNIPPSYGVSNGNPNPQGNQYGIKYWSIGNEQYTAASGIETCYYPTDGSTYGTNAASFISAMKAVDPTIKCGITLYPDLTSVSAWNSQVLSHCGSQVDYIELHIYPMTPGSETDAALLLAPDYTAQIIAQVRAEIAAYYTGNPSTVAIWTTEMGSVSNNPGPQTTGIVQAVYMADACMSLLKQGVQGIVPWGSHTTIGANGRIDSSIYNPVYGFGDLGWLSSGTSAARTVADAFQGVLYTEPTVNTPFPVYYGGLMLTNLWSPGDTMVQASATGSAIRAHAVKGQDGRLRILIVNRDVKVCDVVLTVQGSYTPGATWDVYTYSNNEFLAGTGITHTTQPSAGLAFTQHVPAYSLTVLAL